MTAICDREKTFYFRNKSFPRNDLVPFQCQLKIKPLKDVCWVSQRIKIVMKV
jgi:hypothetical protein